MFRAFLISFVFLPIFLSAQNNAGRQGKAYLDERLNGTSKKNAVFEATVSPNGDGYMVQSYYDNGKPLFIGSYADKKLQVKHGLTKYYHYNGVLQAQGMMENGYKSGVWLYWYDNKQMKDSGSYVGGYVAGLWRAWHPNGSLKGEYNFKPLFLTSVQAKEGSTKKATGTQMDGLCQMFFENGVKEAVGVYDGGRNVGKWEWFWQNGKPSTIEYYNKLGKLDSMRCYDSAGKYQGEFCNIDKPAMLKGVGNFSEYVLLHFKWPDSATRVKHKSSVKVRFIVNTTGKMEQLRVESSERILAETVHRFIKQLPDWYPAVSHNRETKWIAELQIPYLPMQRITYINETPVPTESDMY